MLTKEGQILGCIPEVETTALTSMRLSRRQEDQDPPGLTGGIFGEWGEVEAPFLFTVPDMRAHDDLALPGEALVRLAASAQSPLGVFDSDAECSAATSFAAEAFIPSGLFLPGGAPQVPPRPWAILYGHVLAAERRRNPAGGREFLWARLSSLGVTLELVADPELVPRMPAVGGVLGGSFWLVGRPVAPGTDSASP